MTQGDIQVLRDTARMLRRAAKMLDSVVIPSEDIEPWTPKYKIQEAHTLIITALARIPQP